jgi:predicted chitinase
MFDSRSLGTKNRHRARAGMESERGRRARRPACEPLEGRVLLASILFSNSGAVLKATLDTQNSSKPHQEAEIPITSLNEAGQQADLSAASSDYPLNDGSALARIGVNSDTSFVQPFVHTLSMLLNNTLSQNLRTPGLNPFSSTASVELTGGSAQIAPGPGEKIGDPVQVQVSAYTTTENGGSGSVSFNGTMSIEGGQGQSFSYSGGMGPNDQTASQSEVLDFHIGDTLTVTFTGQFTGDGNGNNAAAEMDADISVLKTAPTPDIALTSASFQTPQSVNLNYSITGTALSQPFQAAIYRSPSSTFSLSTAVPTGIQTTIPATDSGGSSSTTQGQHTVAVNLPSAIGPDTSGNDPYLFVVANPPGGDHIPESDDANDTNDAAPVGIVPTQVKPQTNSKAPNLGGLDVAYVVTSAIAPGTSSDIRVFWASGKTTDDILPNPDASPLYDYPVPANEGPGTYTFTVPAAKLTTAPGGTKDLLVVASPLGGFGSAASGNAVLADDAHLGALTAAQLKKVWPGLSASAVGPLTPALEGVLEDYGITSLEQRAMFLAQAAHETKLGKSWSELYNGDPDQYFKNKYWVNPGQWQTSVGKGPGASQPDISGITLRLSAGKAAKTNYNLYWGSAATFNAAKSTFIQSLSFTRNGKYSSAHFSGGMPPGKTPKTDQYWLLVVDPKTKKTVLALKNTLGNRSPQDATDFRGQGALHLTGRYNVQQFADAIGNQSIMTNAAWLSDPVGHPLLAVEAGAYFWEDNGKQDLNALADSLAGAPSIQFKNHTSAIINKNEPVTSSLSQDRLNQYLRIRALLLDPNF